MFLTKQSLTGHVLTVHLHFPNTFENTGIVFSKCKNLVTCLSHGKPEPRHNRPNSCACHKLGSWCLSSAPSDWVLFILQDGTLEFRLCPTAQTLNTAVCRAVGKGECAAGSMLETGSDTKML